MTASTQRAYRFATEAQWDACLVVRADRDSRGARNALKPFAPYPGPGILFASAGAHAVTITRTGEILWRDDAGALYRLPPGDNVPEVSASPHGIGHARRMVATPDGLWAAGKPADPLEQYETDTLTHLRSVPIADAAVVDIASDGRAGIVVLVRVDSAAAGEDAWFVYRVDCAGRISGRIPLRGIANATAFAFLSRSRRFVVLARRSLLSHPELFLFNEDGGSPQFSLVVGGLRPCFTAYALGSDARARVFLAGADGPDFGGAPFVLGFDGDGNAAGQVPLDPLDAPATDLTATGDSLVVTGPRGLRRFAAAETVPQPGEALRFMCVTPVLEAPDREDGRRWLRVDALATLPEGTAIEVAFAATGDPKVRDRLRAIAGDASPASHRARQLLTDDEPGLWRAPIVFRGSARSPETAAATYSAPLFDVRERYLLAAVTLIAAPGARLPVLSELAVRYPGHSLMENLPEMYKRAEAEPDSFLRKLVGVLEATTQGLDASIATMGSRVHPSTAPPPWLDFIARWLGWPWDDALAPEQKGAIAAHSARLAAQRGTRAGLETLLEALIPGTPRRFRVSDATGDFGFAMLGGHACDGSSLPAMLGGATRWNAELDSRAVLGYSRLPCGAFDDGAWGLTGRIRVEVAASAAERRAWEPWLLSVIRQATPLTTRVELRWVSVHALRDDRLHDGLVLEGLPAPHLGTDAVMGHTRLPHSRARLSSSGPDIGTRLG